MATGFIVSTIQKCKSDLALLSNPLSAPCTPAHWLPPPSVRSALLEVPHFSPSVCLYPSIQEPKPLFLEIRRRRSISPLHPRPSHQPHCFPTTLPLCFPSNTSHPEPRPCVTHELLYCLSSELNVSYWMGSQEICFLKTSTCVPPFSFLCRWGSWQCAPRCEQQSTIKIFQGRIGVQLFLTLLYLELRLWKRPGKRNHRPLPRPGVRHVWLGCRVERGSYPRPPTLGLRK